MFDVEIARKFHEKLSKLMCKFITGVNFRQVEFDENGKIHL